MNQSRQRYSLVTVGVFTCAAIVVFVSTLVHAAIYAPEPELPVQQSARAAWADSAISGADADESASPAAGRPIATPRRLSIPSIGVDAPIEEVGLARSGNMSPPSTFSGVAWYKYGVTPGQAGSAVLAGHVDNGLGLAGVFKHLAQVSVGDDIYVMDANGSKLHFKVSTVDTYSYAAVPTEEIFRRNGRPVIRLLTCAGDWVQEGRTYDRRLAVTAELVTSVGHGELY